MICTVYEPYELESRATKQSLPRVIVMACATYMDTSKNVGKYHDCVVFNSLGVCIDEHWRKGSRLVSCVFDYGG